MPMGKAALFVEPYHFEMTELPTPPVNPGGVLVQITSAGICGSDLHYWRGEMKPILSGEPGPVILGHDRRTWYIPSVRGLLPTPWAGRWRRELWTFWRAQRTATPCRT